MKKFQELGEFKALEVKVNLNWADAGDRNLFWSEYNKPFLDDVIGKGGKFRVVDDVTDPNLLYYGGDKGNPTFFGREVDYLKSKGYTFKDGYAVPKK